MSIIVNQVNKSFKTTQALRQVDFKVEKGELFGVIGPDGAGKSTLFRIMASLMIPDSGSCTMLGFNVVEQYREVRQVIGYMPGRFSLYMDLSVEENLAFYARVFGTTIQANYELIKDIYEQIAPYRKRLAGRLSGGMKQKLALSCALIHRPRVLILDEPTTGVDAVSRMEFWEMLKKIQHEGITTVVSTPYMDEAELCDRVALMQKGNLLAVAHPADLHAADAQLLYSLRSSKGAYSYLEKVRALEGCRHAWLFGDELHVSLHSEEDARAVRSVLDSWKDESLRWQPVVPGIEDHFMALMEEKGDPYSMKKERT